MISASSEETPYKTLFTDGTHLAYADASAKKGGGGAGFGPHALLEASLACCINIWLRMYAQKHSIQLSGVSVRLSLVRDVPGEATFRYAVELKGPLSDDQRRELLEQADTCPVSQTLSRNTSFQRVAEG